MYRLLPNLIAPSSLAGIEPVVVTARALALDIGSAEKAKAWNQATAKVGGRRCFQAALSLAFGCSSSYAFSLSLSIASFMDQLGIHSRKMCLSD